MHLSSLPAALALAIALLNGCTHLEVHKIDGATSAPFQEGAIPYALPRKTFLITATTVLSSCATVIDVPTSKPKLQLDADTTIDVVPINEADPDERYYIPYAQLRSVFKNVNYVVESHANQTLKSFNGTITDQGGAVATAAIGAAIKFAALGNVSPKQAADPELCDAEALAALVDVTDKRTALNPPAGSKVTKVPDAQLAEVVKEINRIVSEKLTSKVVLSWSPEICELDPDPVKAGRSVAQRVFEAGDMVGKWLSAAGTAWMADNPDAKNSVHLVLDVPSWSHPPEKTTSAAVTRGLVLREPAIGTLRACLGACPVPGKNGVATVDNVLRAVNAVVPQLGHKLILPLRNTLTQTSVLDVTMSEDGVLTKVGLRSETGVAATLANLGANAEAARGATEAHDKAKAAALTAAQNKARDENKLLADCLAAQKTIRDNGGTPIGSCQ